MARYLLTTVACLILALSIEGLQTVNGKIKITIQTTAGCRDTWRFVENDLAPTYALYRDYLEVEFVPWGRASRDEAGILTCQFGTDDCWANRLHRCALNLLKDNQDAQVHFMTCEFTDPYPSFLQGSYLCAHAVGLSLVDVDHCVANPGDALDLADEVKGNEMTATLNFIPSIVYNDQMDLNLHNQSFQRFQSMVCMALAADPNVPVTDCEI